MVWLGFPASDSSSFSSSRLCRRLAATFLQRRKLGTSSTGVGVHDFCVIDLIGEENKIGVLSSRTNVKGAKRFET